MLNGWFTCKVAQLTNGQFVLCTIRSHCTELIMLGRKLHIGNSRKEELVPVQPDFPLLRVPLCNLLPEIINSVPCDWIM